MKAKRAELDSLTAGGWSFDSVAVLFGGLVEGKSIPAGQGLPRMGGAAEFDSLVFGSGRRPAVLAPGEVSGWLATGNGLSRFRLLARSEPAREIVERDTERMRREDTERNLIWVANGDGYVSEIDPDAIDEPTRIDVPGSPEDVAFGPVKIWVTSGEGSQLNSIAP